MKRNTINHLSHRRRPQGTVVSLADVAEVRRSQQENLLLRIHQKQSHPAERLIGGSQVMAQLRSLIQRAAPSDAAVLIVGESGTGKELVARALHDAGPRAGKPFVDVNCAALTETLIDSELFGHERGAFTSAISRHRGKFEQAQGGSIFLDEIGDMPLATQAKMLRVLQERTFQRVGGEENVSVSVRVICATNHDLEEAVQKGLFRVDLFYRINMIVIDMPPLRRRLSDVPELTQHFLAATARSGIPGARRISCPSLVALCAHTWPGNVRELQNAIERALAVCDEEEIQPAHLPPAVLRESAELPCQVIDLGASEATRSPSLMQAMGRYERAIIIAALEKCAWNMTRAANALGISPRMLAYRAKKLGMKNERVKVTKRDRGAKDGH